jgi:cobalt/nickel transport protein
MSTPKPRTGRWFFVAFLASALLIAGVVSFSASGHPDGLEYVAKTTGFLDSAGNSATAGSPLADYGVAGVKNARLSVGLAGIIGVLVTLLLAGSLAWLLRRRTGDTSEV